MTNSLSSWIDNMNGFNQGILLMLFGLLFTLLMIFIHKKFNKDGYKMFLPFRRKGKSQSEDNFFILCYIQSLCGIIIGIIITLLGFYKIVIYW